MRINSISQAQGTSAASGVTGTQAINKDVPVGKPTVSSGGYQSVSDKQLVSGFIAAFIENDMLDGLKTNLSTKTVLELAAGEKATFEVIS